MVTWTWLNNPHICNASIVTLGGLKLAEAEARVPNAPYHGNCQGIADPETGFEVQGGAGRSQLAVCHDSNAVGQNVSLLHAVRG